MLQACLTTDVVEIELPFEEYVVVQGTLEKDSLFSGVRITKTLSLNTPYDITNAEIKNAKSYLLINNTVTIPLHYTSNGIYKPLYPHEVREGARYEFFADIDGIQIYGSTNIPDAVHVVSSELDKNGFIRNKIRPNPAYVYGALWEVYNTQSDDFHSIVPDETTSDSVIIVRTQTIPENYQQNRVYSRIYVFDKFYRKYFQSKGSNSSDSLFSSVATPSWNIKSSNGRAIGLFIGLFRSQLIKN